MRGTVDWVDNGGAVAAGVVLVGGDVIQRVGDGCDQTDRRISELGDVVERIGDLRQFALGVIRRTGSGSRRYCCLAAAA